MERYQWSKLNHMQIGRYAEYYVKMEFTMGGFDVYSAEVDDKGIDFVVRGDANRYYDVQVKSLRSFKSYAFARKAHFELRDGLLMALAVFSEGKLPQLYLIPATAWRTPNPLLVDRPYEDKKSPPEWGVNLSGQTLPLLEQYAFDLQIPTLQAAGVMAEGGPGAAVQS